MKKHTAWWTSFAGKFPAKDILAIQTDARPKWHPALNSEQPPDNMELLFLTDRNEVLRGRLSNGGQLQIYSIERKGDDTAVNVTAYMYVMEFLACAMLDTTPFEPLKQATEEKPDEK